MKRSNDKEHYAFPLEDLRIYITSDVIIGFIKSVEEQIQQKNPKVRNPGRKILQANFYGFTSKYKGAFRIVNGQAEGKTTPEHHQVNNLSYFVSANLQNFKNCLVPSFNTGVDLYLKSPVYNSLVRLSLYCEPFFLFDKKRWPIRNLSKRFCWFVV